MCRARVVMGVLCRTTESLQERFFHHDTRHYGLLANQSRVFLRVLALARIENMPRKFSPAMICLWTLCINWGVARRSNPLEDWTFAGHFAGVEGKY